MAIVNVNGVDLYFETTGSGERIVLTHGSWTDATNWAAVVGALAERFQVVTWDRRGHTRSQTGKGPGSLSEDAADLAALIEHLGEPPVHAVGNSYGGSIVLTLLTTRPDLIATAAVHEPPLFALLEGTVDPTLADSLAAADASVATLIEAGDHRGAAEYFVDNVALGAGSWEQLPEPFRAVLVHNAPTYLDEIRDPKGSSIDAMALAQTTVPVLLTRGTESPVLFSAVIAELAVLIPTARVEVLTGAGHIPQVTHPDYWVASFMAFHEDITDAKTTQQDNLRWSRAPAIDNKEPLHGIQTRR
jgi:pimeloyl-ACP methyl ester carboxylesterase